MRRDEIPPLVSALEVHWILPLLTIDRSAVIISTPLTFTPHVTQKVCPWSCMNLLNGYCGRIRQRAVSPCFLSVASCWQARVGYTTPVRNPAGGRMS